jgi:AhpD family alkylhydroperoxidase
MEAGTLDRRLKEIVYLAVSMVNECNYCTHHHEDTALKVGLSDREIEDIRNETDQGFNPKERAALRYAREMTREAEPDGDTRDALWRIFTTDQLVELTLIVCLAAFTNRFSNGLSIPVEGKEVNRTAP